MSSTNEAKRTRSARSKWLQVRMSPEERERLDRVAAAHGMDSSSFVRAVVTYFETHEPQPPLASTASQPVSAPEPA